jgi:tRNA(Ile)-lysidine synthase
MRLLSGAGPLAATGMRPTTTLETISGKLTIVRPLLEIRREQLARIAKDAGICPREDPSNADRQYRRNALRHDVIPTLREVAPGFERALLRSVELAHRDADFVDGEVRQMLAEVLRHAGDAVRIDRAWLRGAHAALGTRAVRAAIDLLTSGDTREIDFERIESVRRAAAGRTGARIQLPYGIDASVERESIVLRRRHESAHREKEPRR